MNMEKRRYRGQGRRNAWGRCLSAFPRLTLVSAAFALCGGFLGAQPAAGGPAVPGGSAASPTDGSAQIATGPYVITSVDFDITGRTKDFVLRGLIDPYEKLVGTSFPDERALEAFIADRTRLLSSQRVLASVTPGYDTTPRPEGGYDVALHFTTVDSWNVIGLPYGKYDSNNGLLLSLRGRDYDFLGSNQPLELNLNYQKDPSGVVSYGAQFDFVAPFQALGSVWDLEFMEDGQIWTDGTKSSVGSTTLTYNIPGLGFPTSVSVAQSFSYDANAPQTDPDLWYLGESLASTASIPFTGNLGRLFGVELGPVTYVPSLELDYAWKPGTVLSYYGSGSAPSAFDTTAAQAVQNSPVYYGRGGVWTSVSNAIAFGRIDWAGNMREGLSFSFTSRAAYNSLYDDLISDLILNATAFAEWNERFGLGARLLGMDRFSGHFGGMQDDSLTMLGQYMRGIIDARMSGVEAAIANFNVPIKLFDFPMHLLIKTHALDFELQAQPFLDLAVVRPDWGSSYSSDWLWSTGGLEFLFYPQGFRSFTIRASAGWDLKSVSRTGSLTAQTAEGQSPYEIYIGLTLFY
ncbi:MAG TPA: hypothetical protein VMC79_05980 [Rectinemataceae bacterium]|nr:hypothetical protein [Rectinemataceae bacterium]